MSWMIALHLGMNKLMKFQLYTHVSDINVFPFDLTVKPFSNLYIYCCLKHDDITEVSLKCFDLALRAYAWESNLLHWPASNWCQDRNIELLL